MPAGYTGTATDQGEIEAAICLDAFIEIRKVEISQNNKHGGGVVFLCVPGACAIGCFPRYIRMRHHQTDHKPAHETDIFAPQSYLIADLLS